MKNNNNNNNSVYSIGNTEYSIPPNTWIFGNLICETENEFKMLISQEYFLI